MTDTELLIRIGVALYAKHRALPDTADIDDVTLAGIVNTVVADTSLILDGTFAPEEFIP